jgi:hypothetical protein
MSIEQMAQTLIASSIEEDTALQSWTEIEDATFSAYASDYIEARIGRVCKGCHGG